MLRVPTYLEFRRAGREGGRQLSLLNDVWGLDWGDLPVGVGAESPGIFTHVSGSCAVSLLGHELWLVATSCPFGLSV